MTSKIGWLRGAAAFVALSSVVSMAQTVDDPDSGFQVAVHPTVPDSYQMSWWAKSGHTYFLQHTTDLKLWTNLDVMEEGTDAVMNFGFAATGVGDFWRLSWTDQVSSNPATADFDSDELTNGYELYTSHTDPLKFDTDGDAMSDKWEIDNSLDPRAQTDGFADADSDGWNNGAEYNRKAKGSGAFTADALSASVGNSLTNWPGGGTEPPPTVGLTTGTLGVDKNGAATYNIPLWVVPGTAGMQPQLALNYSSQSGAGWLGFGWSMSGLSMISRGPQTMAVDENVTGVNFSGTDRFYLDGQRLIAIGTGSYGADGMEYRTEIDSVSKIVANGTAGTGPAWFEVKTKAGLTIEFGHTADSAVDAKNETALGTQTSRDEEFAWAVNKISDTVGNYMEFIYTEDADGHRIERINYTKNGASDHYASVQFVYESRNDISRGYVFGHPVARNLRLKTIAMYYGTTKMREYVLNYANRDLAPSDGKGRSLLMSVQEKAYNASGAASAYPLLEFDYETPGSGWTQLDAGWAPPALLGRHQQSDGEGTGFVDVNGDGRPDLLQYRAASNGTTTARGAWLNTPTGWVSANGGSDATDYRPPKPLAQDTFTGSDSRFVDLDGDGLPDFVDMITGVVYFNTGTGFAQSPASPSGWSFPTPTMSEGLMAAAIENLKSLLFTSEQEASSYPVNIDSVTYERTRGMFIDVDGDGRPDFVGGLGNYAVTGSAIGNTATTHMSEGDGWRNTGSGWERNTNYVNKAAGLAGTRLMDVSGDGRLDVVRNWYGSGTPVKGLWLGTDTGMTYDLGASDARIPPAMLNAGGPGQDNLPVGTEAVDLNGDGLTDIISFNNSSGTSIPNKAYFNKSNGWLEAAFNSPFELTHDNTPQGIAFLDVNSDGLADVIKAWETSSSAYDVRLGTGSGWSASATAYKLPRHIASNGHPTTGTDFVDFDGDGAIDQIWSWQEGGDTAKGIALNQAKPADRLKTITNGFGVVAEITYAPLTEPNADPDLKLYTKGTGGPSDTANVIGPLYVVKTVLNDDGAGGQHIVSYRYGGLRSHRLRGSLGFEWMQTTDSRTGIVSRTDFKQEYPYIGMVASSSTTLGSVTLASSSVTYAQKNPHTDVVLPYAATTVATTNDLAGTLIATTTTEVQDMDDNGNVKAMKISTTSGFEKTTTNRYDQDDTSAGKWLLGRLTQSVVVSSKETGTADDITRTSAFRYDATTGLLTDEAVEPVLSGELLYPSETNLAGYGALTLRTHYTYDGFGNRQVATVRGLKLQVDGNGAVTSAGELESRATTTIYDSQGRLPISQENAAGQEETYGYDDFEKRLGVTASLTGPNVLTTQWDFDAFGQKIGETRADTTGSTIITQWVSAMPDGYVYQLPTFAGSGYPGALTAPMPKYLIATASSGAPPTKVYFDQLGREILAVAINGDGKTVYQNTIYDNLGRVYAKSLPYYPSAAAVYYTLTAEFDVLNRPKTVRMPSDDDPTATDQQGRTYVENSFDYSGLTTTASDPAGRQSSTTQNTQGWTMTSIRNATAGTTAADYAKVSYTYDALGNLLTTKTWNATSDVTSSTLAYDLRGRKEQMTDADMGTWNYRYNPFGELIWQKDANDAITTLIYDVLGRLKTRTEAEGTTTWTYDTATGKGVGKLAAVQVQDPATAVTYAESYVYDTLGRPTVTTRTIDGENYAVGLAYDAFGRPTVTTYPTGFQTQNFYNNYGFLREVRRADSSKNDIYWQAGTDGTEAAYDVSGRLQLETFGNGMEAQHSYDAQTGRLKLARVGVSTTGQQVQYLQYSHSRVGNITARTDGPTGRSESFGYDGLDRLTSSTVSGVGTVNVTYDPLGNIQSKSDAGTYAYAGDGLHAVSGVSGGPLDTQLYAYDDNGNMISGAGRTIDWTSFNQAKRIENAATGHFSEFSFGAGRERVKQSSHLGTTIYIGALYEKFTTPGGAFEHKHYIFAPSGRIAVHTERSDLTQDLRYFHTDGLGSITAVTNEFGTVVKRFAFDAWGKRIDPGTGDTIASHSNDGFMRGFTDHEQLDDLKLVHMNGRIYDPVLGRFLSADPFVDGITDSQGFNRYSYLTNNPLGGTDPSGYFSLKDAVKIVAIVVAAYFTAGFAVYAVGASSGATLAGSFAALTNGGLTLAGAISAGTGAGFGSGFAGSLLNGGSIGDAFKAGVIGGVIGGVAGGITFGIGGSHFGYGGRALAHGAVSGGVEVAQGGQFRHGFYAGFATGLASPQVNGLSNHYRRVIAAAVVGGTASALGGGKFANGAVSGAFQQMLNDSQHSDKIEKFDQSFVLENDKEIPGALSNTELYKAAAYYTEGGSDNVKGIYTIDQLRDEVETSGAKGSRVGIFAHGTDGKIKLAKDWLYGDEPLWRNFQGRSLVFMGCYVGMGNEGQLFVNSVAAQTGNKVWASTYRLAQFKVEGRWNGRLVQTVREEKDVVANKGFDWKVND